MSAPIFSPQQEQGPVRRLMNRLRYFGGTSGRDHTTLDAPNGYGFLTSRDASFVVANAYFTGSAWNRYDTTKAASMLYPDPASGKLVFATAPAGANPLTWTTRLLDLANLSADGIVVAVYERRLFGNAGEAQYANAGTAWTALGRGILLDVNYALPAVAAGATRRYRWRLSHNLFSTTGSGVGNIWLMHNGVPGVGTVRHTIANLANTTWNNATTDLAIYQGPYSGALGPYNFTAGTASSVLQFYGQGPSGGGTLWVNAIDLIAEDYL